jgi:N-acetylmuramic acid 6-phosphate (MurNAc-6-P) etherase
MRVGDHDVAGDICLSRITGSSRLKGGTATKLMLDAAFTAAVILAAGAYTRPLFSST